MRGTRGAVHVASRTPYRRKFTSRLAAAGSRMIDIDVDKSLGR